GAFRQPSPRGCTSVPPDPTAPRNASIRPNQLPPPAFGRLADGRARVVAMSRADEYRRRAQQCLESCTTVPRDGAHVWRPRCAGYPSPHGAGLAAVGRYDRTRAEKATHRPTATASSAQKRREGIAFWIEPNAL